jgi:hypothetical protein
MMDDQTWQRHPSKNSVAEGSDRKTCEIRRAIGILFEPGDVVELRALKDRATASGYFDEPDELVSQATKLEDRGFAVYVTLNSVEPALLARAANRIKHYPKVTTTDTDIRQRRWLPLDFDPVRPSGVSSTDEEKKIAMFRTREVRGYLREQDWPEPLIADSGNGYHLLYQVDLPNDRKSLVLVKAVLDAIAFKFSDEAVEVDTTTCNAARIWKLYGTTARKGDDTEERPHRVSRLLKVPQGAEACRP